MDKQNVADLRKSNFELLRILATLMIVAFHCIEHSGSGEFSVMGESFSFNVATSVLFGSWGTLGVDIFIVLSCWFLVDAKGIRLHKIIILGLQTWFLSLLVTAIVFSIGEKVTFEIIAKEFLTPVYNQFWFVSAYILFYLCIPLLQKSLTQLSDRDLKVIVVVGGVVISLYRFFFGVGEGGELATFSYLFYVVAYLKRIPNNFIERHCMKLSFFIFLAIGGGMMCLNILGNHFNISNIENLMTRICGRNWIPVQVLAIGLFYIFKNAEIRNSVFINTLARGSLGVYVIHENLLFRAMEGIPSILWSKWFHVEAYFYKPYFIIVFALSVIVVYLVCSLIEFVRWKVEQKVMLKARPIIKLFKLIDKCFT